jgi:hypothetical protein
MHSKLQQLARIIGKAMAAVWLRRDPSPTAGRAPADRKKHRSSELRKPHSDQRRQ